ncbi:ComEA family DNA-binding protein [Streptomyces sp. 4R-3d]|uniref:ComEA family DNA-binding protein n=1 Tax=Streptomyces sp. 4R-3d TaxID=2559605 RepID=UPI001072232C|nr:ComEA family DNA-binding protein [Streptomyces sp. 4R-3d]TFI21751.1 ComEA family DNA-binding protein [Streptomyces sp. 4R-3d]
MTLRSHSVTSGPGRAPASDGRARHVRQGAGRGRSFVSSARRPRHTRAGTGTGTAPATTALRRRADALFPVGLADPDAGAARSAASVGSAVPVPAPVPDPAPAPGVGEPPGGRRERMWLAVRERLPLWVQLRCGLEPRTLAALGVVLVVAAVLAAQHFWSGRPQPVRAPETVHEAVATTEQARDPAPLPGAAPSAPASASKRVVVDVSGKVRSPGVRRLPAGSRVTDALRAAGGVEPGADLTGLNRARVLMDGEQVVVGGPQPPGQAAAAPGTGAAGPEGAPVSLSTATVEQLDTLPGVGPVLARHIIDYRTQHGGFSSVGQLREVNGIGERRFADIEPRVLP